MRSMPRLAWAYVCVVIGSALGAIAGAATRTGLHWADVVVLGALYWIGDSAPVKTKLRSVSISTGFPVALAAVLLVGPWGACLVCSMGAVTSRGRIVWFKRAFNVAQMALSALAAGLLFQAIPGGAPVGFSRVHFPQVLPAVALAGLGFCILNSVLVATVIGLSTKLPLARVWWGGMSEMVAPSLGYGLIGLMIAVLWSGGVGPMAGLLVLAPMLIARWAFQQYAAQHQAYEATVGSLIQAVETKDYYTRGHSERVATASVMIAQQLGMREDRLEMLRYAGMLHDVGKLGVPTKLLQKTGPLDDTEFAAIKLHPTRGFEMVNGISFLEEATQGIRHHHERVDGRGYPDGLVGDQIPEFARLIAVADAFDSMTSTRSYRGARSVDAAIRELTRWAGTQFDPAIVGALVRAVAVNGWEASVDATDDVIDPTVLMFRDHDDPSGEVAAGAHFPPYSVRDEQQVS
jgi:hypothetical protein